MDWNNPTDVGIFIRDYLLTDHAMNWAVEQGVSFSEWIASWF